MVPSHNLPAVAEFLEDYRKNALQTIRLVREFEDKDLEIRPGPGSMTTAEQIHQICTSGNFLRGLLEDAEATMELFHKQYDVSSVESAVKSLVSVMREVQRAAQSVTLERWEESIAPFGPDHRAARRKLCQWMIEHEIHHRGQLHVYLRVAGKVPPMLHTPVVEKDLIGG